MTENERKTMMIMKHDVAVRLKSGREFRFQCDEYNIKRFKIDGTISEFKYTGGIGECPIYFEVQDIESISEFVKEQNNEHD